MVIQEQDDVAADRAVALVKAWPVEWVHSGEQVGRAAADLKARHRLSLADAFIAATAQHHGAGLFHQDPEFDALTAEIQLLPLPYRP